MRDVYLELPPQLAQHALQQGGVITTQQTIDAGLDRKTRRKMISNGTLRELRRDFLTAGEYWDASDERERHRIEIAGALMARRWHPTHAGPHTLAAGRRSAGFLHRLPLPAGLQNDPAVCSLEGILPWERRPWHIDLISADRGRRDFRAGVEVRPASLLESHVVIDGVVPISSLARTAVDLMREGTYAEAVSLGDAALRFGADRVELEAIIDHCRKWPNTVRARQAAAFADGRAESPAESLARVVCAEADLFPELQIDLYDAFGKIGRVDLLLRAFRIVLEVDGDIKYSDPWCGSLREALEAQEERERRLREAGWTVIRTNWHELMYEPEKLIARIRAAMTSSPNLV